MSSWLAAAPALLIALALVTVPGLPAAVALRFRGSALLATSIAASFAVIAVTTLLTPLIGVRWGIVPVLMVTVGLAAVAFLLRRLLPALRRPSPRPSGPGIATAVALLIAATLIAFELMRAIGGAGHISQSYDAVFHLNATAQVLSTGDASPLHMNLASPDRATSYYPTLWHGTAALIVQLSGTSIPVATNALVLAVAAWVWPVAIVFFARPFLGDRPMHRLVLGALATVFSAFPYLLLAWGVLYPNFLSTALLPIALGLLHLVLKHRTADGAPLPSLWIAALGATGAAACAHPNALFGLVALGLPLLLATARELRRSDPAPSLRTLRWFGLGASGALIVVLWTTVSPSESRGYDSDLLRGAFSALTNAPLLGAKAWFLTILVLSGAALLIIARRHLWLLFSYLIVVILFAVTVGSAGPLRDFLTGGWYNDAARLAALLPIAAVPLAAVAGCFLLDLVAEGISRRLAPEGEHPAAPSRLRRATPVIGMGLVLVLILLGARGSSIPAQSGWISELSAVNDASPLLSADEEALLDRLDEEIPADARIAGDPWSGTALAYAFTGRRVLFPHLNGNFGRAAAELAADFKSMDPPAACALLSDLGVDYVLDFGGPAYDPENTGAREEFAGLRGVAGSPVLTEIDRQGKALAFRVDC